MENKVSINRQDRKLFEEMNKSKIEGEGKWKTIEKMLRNQDSMVIPDPEDSPQMTPMHHHQGRDNKLQPGQ